MKILVAGSVAVSSLILALLAIMSATGHLSGWGIMAAVSGTVSVLCGTWTMGRMRFHGRNGA